MGDANQCRIKGFSFLPKIVVNAEILTKAETFQDASAKQRMLQIAAQYQDLARRLERAAAD
jgi:hypothetical protein